MIIYYSHTAQAVNLSTAAGLIDIMCSYKSPQKVQEIMLLCRDDYSFTILSHHALCTQQVYLLYILSFREGKRETMYSLC